MHSVAFLQDLAVVMLVAGVVSGIFHRLHQPVVLGYLLAGIIIGPHTPPFPLVHDEESIRTLADLGVVFLMFGLGLEFSLGQLKRVGPTASLAGAFEILSMIWLGHTIGQVFGWSSMDSVFLGAMLAISSSTVIIKTLAEFGLARERFAELVFGILVVEDILAIVILVLLSGVAMTGGLEPVAVIETLGRLGLFLLVAVVAGLLIVPRVIEHVVLRGTREVQLTVILGLCFGVALLAARLDYSVALGAFIIGAVMRESRHRHRVEEITAPVRDLFSAVFFVAIGMLIDPALLWEHAVPVLAITATVILGKILTCTVGTLLSGQDLRTSLKVGISLAQIGEFSFIIAGLGVSLGVTSDFLYPLAVGVSALSALANPYLVRSSDALASLIERRAPRVALDWLEVYRRRVRRLRAEMEAGAARARIQHLLFASGVNAAFIVAIFLAAAFAAPLVAPYLPVPSWLGGPSGLVWLGAVSASLPLYLAILRRLRELATLLAQLASPQDPSGDGAVVVRVTVFATGLVLLALMTLALSVPLLPGGWILLLFVVVIAAIAWRNRARLLEAYDRAGELLDETLAASPEEPPDEVAPHLETMLRGAVLERLTLAPEGPAAGRLIRELAVRSATGATIVAIRRASGDDVINPSPDEALYAGDELLLLGSKDQVTSGRALLLADGTAAHQAAG